MQNTLKIPLGRRSGLTVLAALAVFLAFAAVATAQEERKWTSETTGDGHILVKNAGGAELGYHPSSGVAILTVDGFAFKDLNKNGTLDIYEDWRRPTGERAKDLAAQMSIEEIAGLMLYSSHQDINADVSEAQRKFLVDEHVRAVLIATYSSKADAAKWNNNAQAYAEKIGKGIPINTSSDPRSSTSSGEAYSSGDGDISLWPGNLGFAATFDPDVVQKFGEIASREYRALGIATALSPQIDLATEPRWMRIDGTFGENTLLTTDMTRAYVDGFQTTPGSENGWGRHSVNSMIKHWPGDGVTEKGRESHTFAGKYAVYPGKNFEEHLKPFINGGLKLAGPTGQSSAVMTSYSAAFDEGKAYGEVVGSGFSKWKITDLLREKYGYDGVVCTDWFISGRMGTTDNLSYEKDGLYQPNLEMLFDSWGISWGLEYGISVIERFYKIIEAGADQFGGENSSVPV
ncbi:MAG: beta-glucosidase, partial [Planctomycetota bacterium]|nr:beta-glucosidase [Planctomycetota bacterium]